MSEVVLNPFEEETAISTFKEKNSAAPQFSENPVKVEQTQVEESNLSSRLRYAMAAVKISQSELARQICVKPQVIQYLCNSSVVKSKFTYDVAEALNVNYAWLAEGKGPIFPHDAKPNDNNVISYKVPVIAWEKTLDWSSQSIDLHPSFHKDWMVTNTDVDDNCYALTVKDSSMQPRFDQGAKIIVDPDAALDSGRFVVAHIEAIDEVVLRQYTEHDGAVWLAPTNNKLYKEIPFNAEEDTILGVVVQAHFSFN